jgi:hypothetical protein
MLGARRLREQLAIEQACQAATVGGSSNHDALDIDEAWIARAKRTCALLSASRASANGEADVMSAAEIGSNALSVIATTINKRGRKENARVPSKKDNTRALQNSFLRRA